MHLLTRPDIERLIDHSFVLPLMRQVFSEFAAGRIELPDRTALGGEGENDAVLIMPAGVPAVGGVGTKVISIYPSNADRGLPTISSQIILLDSQTGVVRAVMDGSYITELRTSAVSALATDILARRDAACLGVFGAGAQARHHILAISRVRTLSDVAICSRTRQRAEELCESVRAELPEGTSVRVMPDPADVLASSDIIVTATTSTTPVFDGTGLRPGTHINAIGSFKPHVRELDDDAVRRSKIFVDITSHALREAGDLIGPMDRGVIDRSAVLGELGELVTEKKKGRTDPEDITLFKSVGAAMEDIIVAAGVCDMVDRKGAS